MPPRRLGVEERALWARVIADVRPMYVPVRETPRPPTIVPFAEPPPPDIALKRRIGRVPPPRLPTPKPPPRIAGPGITLDGGWDKRLRKGVVSPDRIVDLHGYTLVDAHAVLDHALADAVASGDRVLLLIAGRERREGPRGGIRRALGDWLAVSRHASRIAAVRPAHPRHGGGGAVYLILRRAGPIAD